MHVDVDAEPDVNNAVDVPPNPPPPGPTEEDDE